MVLQILEEAGWIRATPNVWSLTSLDENIPHFQELYATLGQQWSDRRPGELEAATLSLVQSLSVVPEPMSSVVASTGLGPEVVRTIVDIGELGGYFRTYPSPRDGIEILYTPLFIDEHPESMLNCVAKYHDRYGEIQAILHEAQACPGIAVSSLATTHPLVAELVNSNVLSAPAVDSSSGRQHFLFPHIRTDVSKVVLGKARFLVSCLRYGQSFSTITRVGDPVEVLSRLKQHKMIGRVPHSNIRTQYAPAADAGLGYFKDHGGRFSFHLYETEENLKAVDLAIVMCRGKTESEAHLLLDKNELRKSFADEQPTGIILPASNRANARGVLASRRLDSRSQTYQRFNAALFDDLRGVHRVIR
ncbi:MAG TPA: hypothetical protein VG406_11320 [Isosphaeraceae bacterium]|jgi:hypothetical protein|nr:hypothetical protein [Isosphaeraceae bacterium]